VRGFDRLSRRSLRPTPERLEIEDLLANFRRLELSTESELLIPVTPERAQHNQFTSPASLLSDSPFIPGAFIHSTPQQTPFSFQHRLPTSVPLSPLTPLSASKSSPLSSLLLNPTPSPSLSFLFDFSTCPTESYPDQLSPLHTSSSSSSSVLSPLFSFNPVLPDNPPTNPRRNPSPMAQPIRMPLRGTPNAPKFDTKKPSELPRYLEDVEDIADAAILDHGGKIRAALCYAALDKAELWQTLTEATAIPADWNAFVVAVKKLYPGCEGTNRYC